MHKKPTKISGLSLDKFQDMLDKGNEMHLQHAALIPFHKPGDEMSLTSIFLSSLKLIKEFREKVFKATSLSKSGKILVFTEVEFVFYDKKRVDGLILVLRGNKIVDSALLEMKNKNNEISEKQITDYIQIAKDYKISKLITVSNQFVSNPSQSPINVKLPKHRSMYHFSWSYILTVAQLLLFKNEENILDEDQIEIMNEVVRYFEHEKSGVVGFTQMKPGWTDIVNKINVGTNIRLDDESLYDTVASWLEQERDMSLILSRKLGSFVYSVKKQFKNNLNKRIEYEKRFLIKNKHLESVLNIEGIVSNISVKPHFDRRNIEMGVQLDAPLDRGTKAQLTWVKNQFKNLEKRNPESYANIEKELKVEIWLKFFKNPILIGVNELDEIFYSIKDKEIKSFNILQIKYLGKKFESRKGFVQFSENMIVEYYQVVVQYLKKWEKPAPKIVEKKEVQVQVEEK